MNKPKLSPAMKLAAGYVSIIMVISLFFSIALYRISTFELENSLHRQFIRYNAYGFIVRPSDPEQIQDELSAGEHDLQVQLLLFNLMILAFSSAASYWLAKRTLRPIEDALESQSRFTADASHELRTPLTAIQTEAEVALRNPNLTKEEALALLRSNLEEVGRLRDLSDHLLELARQNGAGDISATVSLEAVATEAVRKTTPAAKAQKVTVDNRAADIQVRGDGHRLAQLVVILLDNAIKYSPTGKTVTLSSRVSGKHAYLSVKDEGIGIKSSDLVHIFDRFYRADISRSKHKVHGYGLGLSIAKKIAEQHGGEITVKSQPDQGSEFTVKLILAIAAEKR